MGVTASVKFPVLLALTVALSTCSLYPERLSEHVVGFGSCLQQWQDQPVWEAVSALDPDVFIFTGDNVYSDTNDYANSPEPQRIAWAYDELAEHAQYRRFREATVRQGIDVLAVWDDHDYGENDAGAQYAFRKQSKDYFMDFFNIPADAKMRQHAGIYQVVDLDFSGTRVQLILLDTRSFRSELLYELRREGCPQGGFAPNNDPLSTVLGDAQWRWLEQQLRAPADLRIIVSSIQLIPTQHCLEKWANFPHERKRFFNLLESTQANGVVLVSGDRHLAEISRYSAHETAYPLYEITSSGLNSAMGDDELGLNERNQYRLNRFNVLQDNFGSLRVIRNSDGVLLALDIRAVDGVILQSEKINLQELQW